MKPCEKRCKSEVSHLRGLDCWDIITGCSRDVVKPLVTILRAGSRLRRRLGFNRVKMLRVHAIVYNITV